MPPFVGVAVNVTLVPEQIAPDGLAEILTPAAGPEVTTAVTGVRELVQPGSCTSQS